MPRFIPDGSMYLDWGGLSLSDFRPRGRVYMHPQSKSTIEVFSGIPVLDPCDESFILYRNSGCYFNIYWTDGNCQLGRVGSGSIKLSLPANNLPGWIPNDLIGKMFNAINQLTPLY